MVGNGDVKISPVASAVIGLVLSYVFISSDVKGISSF
jgi:hypothetical protein